LKFAKKIEQKLLKFLFSKKFQRKKLFFCCNWRPTARQRAVRPILSAALSAAQSFAAHGLLGRASRALGRWI
jgi:hypothetical protein